MIDRLVEKNIIQQVTQHTQIHLCGAPGSGKTSLVQKLFPNHYYFDFNAPSAKVLADVTRKLVGKFSGIIIDHYQSTNQTHSKQLNHLLGDLTDIPLIVVTDSLGSDIPGIKSPKIILAPCLYSEAKQHYSSRITVEEYIFQGTMPELMENSAIRKDYYFHYVSTLATLVNSTNRQLEIRQIIDTLQVLAHMIGKDTSIRGIAKRLRMKTVQVKGILNSLLEVGVLFRLDPKGYPQAHNQLHYPKYYFIDTGLLCYLQGVDSVTSVIGNKATLFENLVVSELYKLVTMKLISAQLYYFHDRARHHLEVILETKNGLVGVDVVGSQQHRPYQFRGIDYWLTLDDQKPKKTWLVYEGDLQEYIDQHLILNWKYLYQECNQITKQTKSYFSKSLLV